MMHRIFSGRIGKTSRRESPSFLASLVTVINTPSDVRSVGTNSEDINQDEQQQQDGAVSGTSGASATTATTTPRPYTNRLISFYTYPNGGRDSSGRTLSEILRFPDRGLEYHHDYIQWLFPLPERSPFNPGAPQIDPATADAFRTRPALRDRLRESFSRMLSFYGFEAIQAEAGRKFGVRVDENVDFTKRSQFWLRQFDHNHLRITRIIRCLRVLGLEDEAQAFYRVLVRVGTPGPGQSRGVSRTTLKYWARAAKRPLQVPPEDDDYPDPEEEEEEERGRGIKEEDDDKDDEEEDDKPARSQELPGL